jgi:hypothetical protein
MNDFLTACGLMCVIEGTIYALFPNAMKRITVQILSTPAQQLRVFGLVFATCGFLMIAFLRG